MHFRCFMMSIGIFLNPSITLPNSLLILYVVVFIGMVHCWIHATCSDIVTLSNGIFCTFSFWVYSLQFLRYLRFEILVSLEIYFEFTWIDCSVTLNSFIKTCFHMQKHIRPFSLVVKDGTDFHLNVIQSNIIPLKIYIIHFGQDLIYLKTTLWTPISDLIFLGAQSPLISQKNLNHSIVQSNIPYTPFLYGEPVGKPVSCRSSTGLVTYTFLRFSVNSGSLPCAWITYNPFLSTMARTTANTKIILRQN